MKYGLRRWHWGFISLLTLLGGTQASQAQTTLGQPSLDEAKVQIWCAALRYVYDDTGHPQLKNSLRCEAGNLPALAASIRPDSQRVYSLLYQPIEGRGSIYQGKKDDAARLTALSKAIVSRLRASPARRKDPVRLARLAALETTLGTYVTSGTPPGELAASAPALAATADTAAGAPPVLGPAEAAEEEAAAARPAASSVPPADATGSLMSRIFAPLALTLALLSLVLFGLLRANVSRLLRRQQREVSAAQEAARQAQAAADHATRATADAAASAAAATVTAAQIAAGASAAAKAASELPLSLSQLSAGQRAEVESLIQQGVAAEVARILAASPAAPATLPKPAVALAGTPPD